MGSHAALIYEVEHVKEGSRSLSDKVLVACGWKHEPHGVWWGKDAEGGLIQQANVHLSHPTCNLQDAVDAVSVECSYIELHIELPMEGCDTVCTAIIRIDNETRHVGTSATAPLALSAANVKAREAQGENHE